jgi:hypothetical protein
VSWRVLLLGLVAFVVVLVAVFPAGWVGGLLPAFVQCGNWKGTLWRGSCRQLTVALPGKPRVTLESTGWTLHALPLLRGRVAAEFVVADARAEASGHVELARGPSMVLRDTSARAAVDPQLPTFLPPGWRGHVEVAQLELDWVANELRHLQGDLRFLDLQDEKGQAVGSYHLVFPPSTAPPFKGQLNDEGGPLDLRGTLELTADRHWTLDGSVVGRGGNASGIAANLQILGAPDASGRYPLSATGSFR